MSAKQQIDIILTNVMVSEEHIVQNRRGPTTDPFGTPQIRYEDTVQNAKMWEAESFI